MLSTISTVNPNELWVKEKRKKIIQGHFKLYLKHEGTTVSLAFS